MNKNNNILFLIFIFLIIVCFSSTIYSDNSEKRVDWINFKNEIENKLKEKPEDGLLNFKLGIALANIGEIKKSYEIFDGLEEKTTRNKFKNRIQEHIKNLDKNLLSNKIKSWNYIAFTALIEEDYSKAITFFKKILQKRPDNIWIRNYMAATFVEKENYDTAKKEANKALDINENEFSHLILGVIYYKEGKYINSIKELNASGKLFKSMIELF